MGAAIGGAAAVSGAFLMGRTLYEEWSAYWPAQADEEPFASFINEIPKDVFADGATVPLALTAHATFATGVLHLTSTPAP